MSWYTKNGNQGLKNEAIASRFLHILRLTTEIVKNKRLFLLNIFWGINRWRLNAAFNTKAEMLIFVYFGRLFCTMFIITITYYEWIQHDFNR